MARRKHEVIRLQHSCRSVNRLNNGRNENGEKYHKHSSIMTDNVVLAALKAA